VKPGYLTLHATVWGHPKLDILADELEVAQPYALGLVTNLWLTALRLCPETGDLGQSPIKQDARRLARQLQHEGDPLRLVESLRKAGWLDGWVIHEWKEHQAQLLNHMKMLELAREGGKKSGETRRRQRREKEQEESGQAQLQNPLPKGASEAKERKKERNKEIRAPGRAGAASAGAGQGPAPAAPELGHTLESWPAGAAEAARAIRDSVAQRARGSPLPGGMSSVDDIVARYYPKQ
jgi:hypothetical protein